ncbi:hypothetical protein NDU88_002061 [Pleurodeles waltl]|uniref:Uncharacterized protein n=1 Tax=Pleurodeles waltl TaxID=8319 RepID=A0AAV7VA50_PLEWA|nr:hypothetical protein NDU88_002061 [Pleurodeles waltl]
MWCCVGLMFSMGRAENKQMKLSFDAKKAAKTMLTDGVEVAPETTKEDIQSVLLHMQQSLTAIYTKIDSLTEWVDTMASALAKQENIILAAKSYISVGEDNSNSGTEKLLSMQKVLYVIQAKN